MDITVHRGTHQIGGTCIEVRSGGRGILLDVGLPLDADERLSQLHDGKSAQGQDLMDAGVTVDVPGLYRWDKRPGPVDAILISHPHLDHYGLLRYIKPEIPVYMGEQGWKIIGTAADLLSDTSVPADRIIPFEADQAFEIAGFTVTPYLMDHSAFDSYAFHITDGDKSIIYTGDFRAHGRKAKLLNAFIRKAPKNVDALLIEGTMLSRQNENVPTEEDFEKQIAGICRNTDNIVLAYCSAQNIDRLVTFYRAAKRTGRMFAVDIYTAHILASASEKARIPAPGPNFPAVKTYFPRWLSKRIADGGKKDRLYRFTNAKIDKDEIRQNRSKIVMLVRPSVRFDLERIGLTAGTQLIYSLWGGYLKDSYTADFVSWVEGQGGKTHMIHTSGHATVETLRKVVHALQPGMVLPVHSEVPDNFSSLAANVRTLQDNQIITL